MDVVDPMIVGVKCEVLCIVMLSPTRGHPPRKKDSQNTSDSSHQPASVIDYPSGDSMSS